MDSINEILNSEKTAEEIKRKASETVSEIINSAEAYRADSMKKARIEGDAKAKELVDLACAEARSRAAELRDNADDEISRIRILAAANLEKAAEYISEKLTAQI